MWFRVQPETPFKVSVGVGAGSVPGHDPEGEPQTVRPSERPRPFHGGCGGRGRRSHLRPPALATPAQAFVVSALGAFQNRRGFSFRHQAAGSTSSLLVVTTGSSGQNTTRTKPKSPKRGFVKAALTGQEVGARGPASRRWASCFCSLPLSPGLDVGVGPVTQLWTRTRRAQSTPLPGRL